MKVGKSVKKSIDEWEAGDFEAAMMHACAAIDGTARKLYGAKLQNKVRFTKLLRDYYGILGWMSMPGINLAETRFPVRVGRPTAFGGKPDFADVIYGIHRCCHAHGEELPDGFELVPDARESTRVTQIFVEKGKVSLSDRTIFGLIAVAVFCPVNVGECVPTGYHLIFGEVRTFMINDPWGRAAEFPAIAPKVALPSVTLDFGEWMEDV